MDSVKLPSFSSTARVDDALDQLRVKKRSGLVIKGIRKQRLLHTGDLLYAQAEGILTLGDVERGQPVLLLQDKDIAKFKLDSAKPERTGKQYERYLHSIKHRYTLIDTTGDSVMVVTASELDALALTDTGGYECDGNPTHYFPLPRVIPGQTCPLWPACGRPGGGKTKIRPVP